MSRYIDADILLEAIEELTWYHPVQGKMVRGAKGRGWYKSNDIFKAIESVTSADAVKVVRCKECKWWTNTGEGITGIKYGVCQRGMITPMSDYCSYGAKIKG